MAAKRQPSTTAVVRYPVTRKPSKRQSEFREVAGLITAAREQVYQAVNTTLIDLYWQVGAYLHAKLESAAWGEGVVAQLAAWLASEHPEIKGFTRSNLFRMKQFHATYVSDAKVAPLARLLPWTQNVIILAKCKRPEEREFYLRMAVRERWSKRELEHQLATSLFERQMLSPQKVSAALAKLHPTAAQFFRDEYTLAFLHLPEPFDERDLQRGLVANLKHFLLELGRDFCFVGEQYQVQVGGRDFYLDLLFFHRELQCLVAFELKIADFEPEYLGKMSFYLEALDRDVRKAHENPSVGILLCKGSDSTVVEYALSRTLSPTVVAEYRTKLPTHRVLLRKLRELGELAEAAEAYHASAG